MYRKPQRQDAKFGHPKIYVPGGEIEDEHVYGNASTFTVNRLEEIAGEIEEQPVYGNVDVFPVGNLEPTSAAFSVDKQEVTSDHKHCLCTRSFLLQASCWLILIGVITVLTYFVVTSILLEDDAKRKLSDYGNLTMNLKDATEQLNNLTRAKLVLEDENKNLKTENQQLKKEKAELESERKNLTAQTQNIEAEWIKFNANHVHWSIDAYCPKEQGKRTCKPCEKGWLRIQSSCHAVNDHQPSGQRNWEGAQDDCKRKDSDLVVVADDNEKKTVSDNSWDSSGHSGYWIGLRVKHGKWKWVDGSDLAKNSWIADPPTDGQCVISVHNEGWKSVSCSTKQRWVCEKAALSV